MAALGGLMVAAAYALTLLSRTVVPPLFPAAAFLTFDFKDIILAVSALILGPAVTLCVTAAAAVLEMITISSTGWIGLVMNIISSMAFVLPCALMYKRKKTWANAVVGLMLGVLTMTAMMLLWNAFLTPLYMGMPRKAVLDMLIPVFLPFNLLKGGINAGLTLLLYKPLVKALRAAKLLPRSGAESTDKKRQTAYNIAVAAVVLIICAAAVILLNRA